MSPFVRSGSRAQHEPLPSLPPSPTEEDLGGASLWRETQDEDFKNRETLVSDVAKGKGKAREVVLDDVAPAAEAGYPPTTEDEDESRRIEENLKRWEQAERQRRKSARDSAASSAPSNVVGDVTRRASFLWPGRLGGGTRTTPNGAHVHTALRTTSEDALPLTDITDGTTSPGASIPMSPASSIPTSSASPTFSSAHLPPIPPIVENPFEPPDSATPLQSFSVDNGKDVSAVMRPSSPSLPDSKPVRGTEGSPFDTPPSGTGRSSLQASLRPRHPLQPPPRPLDPPLPKTSPSRVLMPSVTVSTPPKRVSPPARARSGSGLGGQSNLEEEREHRWWTDWLCGCWESADEQAGRTNPFE